MPWDQGSWDAGGTWDSVSAPPNPPNPKPKKKPMLHQDWFPTRIGDQIVWLRNFKTKLPGHATLLALVAGDVTARLLDVDNAIFGLEDYRNAVTTHNDAAFQRIDDALGNPAVPGNIVWLGFTPPAAPAAVLYGCLRRVFDYITDVIKKAPACDAAIRTDLRIEPPAAAALDPTTSPVFSLRETTGGKMEVVWTKKPFDGVKLEFDLGTAGTRADVDLRPNYTLNWLPATGASAIIKVRLRFIYKGEDFGNWSAWQSWTLTGV